AASELDLLHFDSIGVPPADDMVRDFGSGENWQRLKTIVWITKIASHRLAARNVIFEGQMRIAFIVEALEHAGVPDAKILLIDCSDADRSHRLTALRNQPELNNDDMQNWAAYLRAEARQRGLQIIDTSKQSVADAADRILA